MKGACELRERAGGEDGANGGILPLGPTPGAPAHRDHPPRLFSGCPPWGYCLGGRIGRQSLHAGGLWDTTALGGASWAIFYVHVDDVPAAISRAEELGATVVLPLVDNGTIQFAHLIDPTGSRFAVWRPNEA